MWKKNDVYCVYFCVSQIRWTKTAGSVSDRFQDSSVFNETLHIAKILRTQGGRYYCKAENGLGSPAIKSIRVDVYCKSWMNSSGFYHKTIRLGRAVIVVFVMVAQSSLSCTEDSMSHGGNDRQRADTEITHDSYSLNAKIRLTYLSNRTIRSNRLVANFQINLSFL